LGIVVMNTPAGNTLSTAEHAIALMLALARNIAPANQSLVQHAWERGKFMGTQVADKALGIIGLGRIGQAVARRAKALEMRLLGFDPFLSKERAQELGVDLVGSIHDMLPRIDFLTVHVPGNEETVGMIGAKEIDMLKPGARLINCARGGIYDEAALLAGLQSGKLAGVALDVYATEPCTDSPLFGLPGVVCTPHLGASTEEAQTNVAVEGCGLLIDYLTTGAIRHAVNMTSIEPARLEALRGYLDLSYRLGLLLAQLTGGAVRSCRLRYRGEVATKETRLLTSTFAAGLLQHALEDEVNIVNAEVVLRERGIELSEDSGQEMGAFNSVITAEVTTDRSTWKAAGTLFGHKMVRLVQLGDHRLDSYLDGVLLVFTHRDVPGIIGRVGTTFGQHQVNIAQMSVGRAMKGGEAIGVLNLDSVPSSEAVAEVAAQPDMTSVHVVKLPAAGELPSWLGG
jgi:D-3-phosphoglycerate dehydrogenase